LNICSLLLEQDGAETSVESTNTLVLQHLAESTDKTAGICWLRDETDTGSLKGAKGDIGEEFCKSRRSQVDCRSIVGGSLISEDVDGLLLEEFISPKLECALEEVAGSSWPKTSQQSTSTFLSNNLSETSKETSIVCDGVELDSCLDAVQITCQCASFYLATRGADVSPERKCDRYDTYTSTGVRPPWVTEQQTAPAKANLE